MQKPNRKRIIVSVTTDLVSDNRVHKTCTTLTKMGFEVLLIGRKLPKSLLLDQRIYRTKRFRLLFTKGLGFYAEFNFRLFIYLLFSKAELFLSNDLDTLLANFVAAKINGKKIIYDSHEYFTEVPELVNRPRIKKIWEGLEKRTVPKVDAAYTVCSSIANIYSEKFKIQFGVVRNLPYKVENNILTINTKSEQIILYQGAVNVGRGLKQAILSMQFIQNAKLVIAGDGDIRKDLEQLVIKENLQNKVQFLGRLSIQDLAELTPKANIGLSIEEDLGLNYRFALPNKLFDYIQAQVPVLVTNLPEMAAVVHKYKIGEITHSLEPKLLASKISEVLNNQLKRKTWHEHLKFAAAELNWQNEEKVLKAIYSKFI